MVPIRSRLSAFFTSAPCLNTCVRDRRERESEGEEEERGGESESEREKGKRKRDYLAASLVASETAMGVARPRAHGHAITITERAFINPNSLHYFLDKNKRKNKRNERVKKKNKRVRKEIKKEEEVESIHWTSSQVPKAKGCRRGEEHSGYNES